MREYAEVFILKDRDGLFVVAEEATRDKGGILSSRINEADGRLTPAANPWSSGPDE